MSLTISKKIKYLYWFFTICIVLFHSYRPTEFDLVTTSRLDSFIAEIFPFLAERLGYISLTFFFFMSGFWLYYNVRTNADIVTKIRKRVRSLLLPYLLWTTIFLVPRLLMREFTIIELLKNLHNHFIFTPVIGAAWYILSLLLLLLIFPPLAVTRKNKIASAVVFSVMIVYYMVIKYSKSSYLIQMPINCWWYGNVQFYMPVYLFGSFIGLNYPHIVTEKEYNSKIYLIAGIILMLLSCILFYLVRLGRFYVLFSAIFVIGLWFVIRNNLFDKDVPKIFDAEFFVFILHQPLILPIMTFLFRRILPISNMNSIEMLVIKAVNIISVIIVSYVIRLILEKTLPRKIFNLFSGGR